VRAVLWLHTRHMSAGRVTARRRVTRVTPVSSSAEPPLRANAASAHPLAVYGCLCGAICSAKFVTVCSNNPSESDHVSGCSRFLPYRTRRWQLSGRIREGCLHSPLAPFTGISRLCCTADHHMSALVPRMVGARTGPLLRHVMSYQRHCNTGPLLQHVMLLLSSARQDLCENRV
jgi:hypothetical protein